MSGRQNPSDFLKQIIGRPVVVKLNSGVDYRGRCPDDSWATTSKRYLVPHVMIETVIIIRILIATT